MHLRELELDEFRAFRKLDVQLAPAGVRIVGSNASGKSTLLEAIAMLATFRSPRTSAEREIVNWHSGQELTVPPYARARGVFDRGDGRHTIELALSLDARGSGALRKTIRYDDRPVRAIDAVGELKTVLFSPDDVNLISGPPSGRRRYLDVAASQASKPYVRALARYGRVLEQRNSLLRSFARERHRLDAARQTEELAYWDAELTTIAADVVAIRLGVVQALARRAKEYFALLAERDTLDLNYVRYRQPEDSLDLVHEFWQTPSQGLRQTLLASLRAALELWRADELRRGMTAVGPHRDDFIVTADTIDVGRYGSRGQQRVAVVALKLAELDLLHDAAGDQPVLLLDDVLSELDAAHRSKVAALIASRKAQVCVTATDLQDLDTSELQHLPVWQLAPGTSQLEQ